MDRSLDMSGHSVRFSIDRTVQSTRGAVLVLFAATALILSDDPGLAAQDEKPTDKSAAPVVKTQPLSEKPVSPQDGDAASLRKATAGRLRLYGYVPHEHSVTISGQTLNENGEPVAGARVIVVPVIPMGFAYDERHPIAEGMTDARGRYRFEDVKLSVLEFAPKAVPRPSEALFQVFAVAEGYGCAWRHTRAYRPEKRPAEVAPTPEDDDDEVTEAAKKLRVFFSDDPIEIDLKLSPEVRIHGTIRDDLGNPLKGAVVQLGYVSHSRGLQGNGLLSGNGTYLQGSSRADDGRFEGYFALPKEFRTTVTDAHGRYEIRGVPRDCDLAAAIDYLPEYDPWYGDVQTGETFTPGGHPANAFVGYTGELNQVFVAPVIARVKVLGAARQPLANVMIRVESARRVRRTGTLSRTDASGVATLKLRLGNTKIVAEPEIGVAYLPTSQSFDFKTDPRDYAIELELAPAAEVTLEAIDKETGKPVAGVAFLSEPDDVRERKPVQSQISFVDHPRTDATGQLRAFFAPGTRRFFVDQKRSSPDFEPVSPTTDAIELTTEHPERVCFEFTRRQIAAPPTTTPVEPVADELKPLEELLLKQAERYENSRSLRVQLGHTNYVETTMTREQITELLESFSSKSHEECLDDLNRAFGFTANDTVTLITDGVRRRVDSRYSKQTGLHVNAFNGEEMIYEMGNEQLNIHSKTSSNIHFLDVRDFWNGPAPVSVLAAPKSRTGGEPPKRTVHHTNGNWVIDVVGGATSSRRMIDNVTGFERLVSMSIPERKFARETWQFFPILLHTGVAFPKLSIALDYHNGAVQFRNIVDVASVELLDKLPPDAFIVGAPAGTNILDYRGMSRDRKFEQRPPSGVISADIPDVVAYRNQFAPAAEPVLKPGDKSPELNVVTWLNSDGKADQPDLAGKIVVIDFWGIGCGPCVAALPKVNAAAKHFADSMIVVIGLHDSGGTLASVSEFAKKRGLVFPIAIDNPDPAKQSFGATFSAYGIHGIPTCVVIDGSGRVAYIGEFDRAVEAANQLVNEE